MRSSNLSPSNSYRQWTYIGRSIHHSLPTGISPFDIRNIQGAYSLLQHVRRFKRQCGILPKWRPSSRKTVFVIFPRDLIQLVPHTPRNSDPYVGYDGETGVTRLANLSAKSWVPTERGHPRYKKNGASPLGSRSDDHNANLGIVTGDDENGEVPFVNVIQLKGVALGTRL